MNCQVCDYSSPEGARFCMNCGAPLVSSGAATPLRNLRERTPDHLAQKIIAGRRQLEGERRTVTVLFADLAGSTAMEEKLDPEHAYRIMQDAVARMSDCVQHCEGTITQFRGDGIMALFGAPIAHENSAHRAVAAGLAMQRRLEEYSAEVYREYGVEPHFRVGLNTGLVVVGSISDDLTMDYTPMGDTVNLAARMEQAAEPGTVYISENTFRAVRDYVECEPLGEIAVKGKSEPIPAYRAVRDKGARSRLEIASDRGLTPFVGRKEPLAVLLRSMRQVEQGAGRVVSIGGEAGIGKSRLLLEFRRQLPDGVTWLEARCSPPGAGPSQPLAALVRAALDVSDCDDQATLLARIESGTAGWPEESRATVPYLKYFLGIPHGDASVGTVAPIERRGRIREALQAVIVRTSRRSPLVVVVEDLHWMDERTNSMLLGLVGAARTAPVLIVLTHRPGTPRAVGLQVSALEAECLPSFTSGDQGFFQRLSLAPLSPEDSFTLAGRVLGGGLPDEVQALITGKAEGNPFFMEEVSRSLLQAGLVLRNADGFAVRGQLNTVRLPESIEEVVMARIDTLQRGPRETLQLASIIGREFAHSLLGRISDPQARLDSALSELEDLDFIYETAYVPEMSYAFKHAITGEVAYSTLLQERRKALHRIVATTIEEMYADRVAEHVEELARHYLEAEAWDKALDYVEKAGDKAFAVFANEAAIDWYTKAISVCQREAEPDLRHISALLMKRSNAHFVLRHYVLSLEDQERRQTIGIELGDAAMEAQALLYRGMWEGWHQIYEGAITNLEATLDLAAREKLDHIHFYALVYLMLAYYDCHRMDEARTALQAAVELVDRLESEGAVSASARLNIGALQAGQDVAMPNPSEVRLMRFNLAANGGLFLSWTGQFDNALALLERNREAGVTIPNIFGRLQLRFAEALALGGKGEYERALELLDGVIATCEELGEHFFQGRMINTIGWICGELQDFDRAIVWNQRSLDAARGYNPPGPEVVGNALANLADNCTALGRLDEAEVHLNEIAEMVDAKIPKDCLQLWRYTMHHFASFAELWLARGDWDRAITAADECLALADKTESRKYLVRARRSRGEALLALGKLDEAEREIGTALAVAVDVGNPPQLWRTHAALGGLRRAQGRQKEARQAYGAALRVIEEVAGGLSDTQLRNTFLHSEHVRGIQREAVT